MRRIRTLRKRLGGATETPSRDRPDRIKAADRPAILDLMYFLFSPVIDAGSKLYVWAMYL